MLLIVALVVPPGVAAVAARLQHYPRRFAEVVPGALYRGGLPTGDQIRRLADEKRIRTVISLAQMEDEPGCHEELQAVNVLGLRFLRVPMAGDGCGSFEDLDKIADALADQSNWPIFLHCGAGKQRSNAAVAAYRLRKCRWTIDQVLNELEERYDLDRVAEKTLVDHLRRYAQRTAGSPGRSSRMVRIQRSSTLPTNTE
jgi:protein tyrosine/serine phosphatase